jgi:hypothetical protein
LSVIQGFFASEKRQSVKKKPFPHHRPNFVDCLLHHRQAVGKVLGKLPKALESLKTTPVDGCGKRVLNDVPLRSGVRPARGWAES